MKKQKVKTVLDWIIRYFLEHGVQVVMPEESAGSAGYGELGRNWDQVRSEVSLGITIGGDGTLLHVARELARAGIPLCGINMGKLGFLTEVELSDVQSAVDRIRQGQYTVEERLMLDAIVVREGTPHFVSCAMNDIVVIC
jgi:NAD+ kinase